MRSSWPLLAGLCLSSLLTGCSTSSNYHKLTSKLADTSPANQSTLATNVPEIYSQLFIPVDTSQHQIFELSDEQKANFFDYFYNLDIAHISPHQRVADYLFNLNNDFTYHGKTYNATNALAKKQGNCMSLAVLSTAIAKLVGVDYQYREVHSTPVYTEYSSAANGHFQTLSTHVNLTLVNKGFSPDSNSSTFSYITIDYFKEAGDVKSSRVSQNDVEIMYWHNLAADALIDNRLDLAFTYTLKAHKLDSLHPDTLNLLAILYGRKGREDLAYKLYDSMDKNKLASFAAIDNFASLLRKRGNVKRANQLSQNIATVTEDNPYTWIKRGKAHLEKGRLTLAEAHFLKAAKKASYLHEPYFLLAKIYAQQSKLLAARQALEKAQSLAYLPEDEKRYLAKLAGLSL